MELKAQRKIISSLTIQTKNKLMNRGGIQESVLTCYFSSEVPIFLRFFFLHKSLWFYNKECIECSSSKRISNIIPNWFEITWHCVTWSSPDPSAFATRDMRAFFVHKFSTLSSLSDIFKFTAFISRDSHMTENFSRQNLILSIIWFLLSDEKG